MLELESELVNLRAEHAADDTQLQQQRTQLAAQEKGLRDAQVALQKAQEEKQVDWQLAALIDGEHQLRGKFALSRLMLASTA